MKQLLPTLLLFSVLTVQAQQPHQCASHTMLEAAKDQIPGLSERLQVMDNNLQQLLEANPGATSNQRDIITIPVIVHVVYNTASQNISEAQIQSQIDVLNEDYRRLNADAFNTRPQFETIAADAQIQFCLADTDPDGNPSNGITRTSTNIAQWTLGNADNAKKSSSGGIDGWPRNSYLNIWVVNLSGDILGYAYPPGVPAWMDGAVIKYTYFGRGTGILIPPYNLGRTTTHEVGHWLDLSHIWGDGGCGQDDGIDDTPNAGTPYYGCPSNPSTCGDLDNHENYMDYTNDGCMNMFTAGQVEVMQAILHSNRSALLNSNGCVGAGSAIEDVIDVSNQINVFPNPTDGTIWVDFNFTESDVKVKITNLLGQIVESKEDIRKGVSAVSFDLSNRAEGIYFAHLTADGVAGVKKIVVEK
jgi:hypothetical protein